MYGVKFADIPTPDGVEELCVTTCFGRVGGCIYSGHANVIPDHASHPNDPKCVLIYRQPSKPPNLKPQHSEVPTKP